MTGTVNVVKTTDVKGMSVVLDGIRLVSSEVVPGIDVDWL